jgi:hypothetical protein
VAIASGGEVKAEEIVMTEAEFEEQQSRHERRMMLMQMQGETERMAGRAQFWMAVAAVLVVIALGLAL